MNERFKGLILFKKDYKETDGLIKIFTREYGSKMFFVKHMKSPNNALRGLMLIATENDFVGTINETGLSFIKEGQRLNLFQSIQENYLSYAYVVYMMQLLDAAVEDGQADPTLYDLTLGCIHLINQGVSVEVVVAFFEMKLLPAFGILINWSSCVRTGAKVGPFDFSIVNHGIISQAAWDSDYFRLKIHPKAMHVAILLANMELEQFNSAKLSNDTIAELRRLMDTIYQEYVGLRLKSKSYLDQMLKFNKEAELIKEKRRK